MDSSRFIFGDGARGRSKSMTSGSNTLGAENSSGFYFGNNTTGNAYYRLVELEWYN
jgi:hypothetical protein